LTAKTIEEVTFTIPRNKVGTSGPLWLWSVN